MAVYGVNGIKSFRGREGYGLNANLLLDGKKIADILDDGGGGAMRFYFNERADEVAFEAFAAKWFAEANPGEEAFEVGAAWVEVQVNAIETEKRLKRLAKSSTPYRLKGDKPDEWRLMKMGGKPAPVEFVRQKYGDTIEIIYGEMVAKP